MPATASSSSSNFQSIFDLALSDYVKQTNIDLSTHSFIQSLQSCDSPEHVLDLLAAKAKQFRAYRDGNRKLINCLKPVVQVLHTVSGILGEASTMASPAMASLAEPSRLVWLYVYGSIFRCHFNLQRQSSSESMSSSPCV